MSELYNIIRFYKNGRKRIIVKNVSLQEAKEHCNNPKTEKDDKYFDDFTKA